jgi:hypothetical protein
MIRALTRLASRGRFPLHSTDSIARDSRARQLFTNAQRD